MGSVDGASWKYKRLDFVPCSFQVSLHLVEYHPVIPTNKAAYIFAHDPARANFPNCSKHMRPEVSVILFAKSFTCCAVRLAREAPGEEVKLSSPNSEIRNCDIFVTF
jgi:hypothetical protein